MELKFSIENQTINRIDNFHPVAGSQEYLKCKFTFTDDWKETSKVAFFYINDSDVSKRIDLTNDECLVPTALIKAPILRLYVYGYGNNNLVKISTGVAAIVIGNSRSDLGEAPNLKYIDSNTLDVSQDGERASIEVPNIYSVSFEETYNSSDAYITVCGRDSEELDKIDLKGAIDYYKPIILSESETNAETYVKGYTYSKEALDNTNNTQNVEINKKANVVDVNKLHLTYEATTGVVKLLNSDNEVLSSIDLPTELIVTSGRYDPTTQSIILVLANGNEIVIPASGLIDDYTGGETTTISVSISNDNQVTATIKNSSITRTLLDSTLQGLFDKMDVVTTNEETRIANETTRQSNEATRQTNEVARVSAEEQRVSAEEQRVSAESARVVEFEQMQEEEESFQTTITNMVEPVIDEQEVQATQIDTLKLQLAQANVIIHQTVAQEVEETYNEVDTMTTPSSVDISSVSYPVIDNSYFKLNEVGGETKAFNQLINPANYPADKTENNVTFTKQSDNSIKVVVGEGGATSTITYIIDNYISSSKNKYLLKGNLQSTLTSTISLTSVALNNSVYANDGSDVGSGIIFNLSNTIYTNIRTQISVKSGCPAGTYIFKPNLIDLTLCGDDTLTLEQAMAKYNQFYAYDSGSLKDSKITSLKSTGKNWFSGTNWVKNMFVNGVYAPNSVCCLTFNEILPNTTYKYIQDTSADLYEFVLYNKNKTYIKTIQSRSVTTFTTTSDTSYVRIQITNNTSVPSLPTKYMITTNLNANINDFAPYQDPSLITFDEAQELKSAGTVQDKLVIAKNEDNDLYTMKKVITIGSVDLGSLSWEVSTINNIPYFKSSNFDMYNYGAVISGGFNIICAIYTNQNSNDTTMIVDKDMSMWSYAQHISIINKSYTDKDRFKSDMSGVMLDYELATPTEEVIKTDLTLEEVTMLTQQNGSIEVVNENSIYGAKPSLTLDFDIKYWQN